MQQNPVKKRDKSTPFKSISGISRVFFLTRMKILVFFYFVHRLFSGKISLQFFLTALSKLDKFSQRQSISKFIKFDNGIRTGLYVPTFPSSRYFSACEKMFEDTDTMSVIIAVVSISKKCCYSCDYCYQHYDDPDNEMPLSILLETIEQIQNDGAVIFKLEGGEPFLSYDRLKSVCQKIDRRSEIWINTTGVGTTYERLIELKELGVTAYKISVHHPDKNDYNAFFGKEDAWDIMTHTIENLNQLNIPYSFNTFFKPDDYYNGKFETIMNLARDWGASYIQCLTPRVAGGNIHNKSIVLTEAELDKLGNLLYQYNRNAKYKEYPPIFCDEYDERRIIGCTAGSKRIYINSTGEVQPCQHLNVSFGNVCDEPYKNILQRTRKIFQKPGQHTACALLSSLIASKYTKDTMFPISITEIENDCIRLIHKSISDMKL